MESIRLAKTAPWNSDLRNAYRERYAFVAGRRFKVSAKSLNSMWWVEEVDHDGRPTFGGARRCEIVSWCGWAHNLTQARQMIAEQVAQ